MSDDRLSFRGLVRGALSRVHGALLHHAAIAYLYILPALALVMTDAFDTLLLILLRRHPEGGIGVAEIAFGVVVLLWGAFIMTTWYRLSLLGPREYLKIDLGALFKRTGKFLLYGLAVAVMTATVFLIVMSVLGLIATAVGDTGHGLIATLGAPFAIGLAVALGLRFLPALTAATLGRMVGLGDAWRMTAGESGLILAAALTLMTPAVLVSGLAEGGITQLIFGPLADGADNVTALAWMKGSIVITVMLAPLSGAANALLTGIAAELYARLVGPPLDARGMTV